MNQTELDNLGEWDGPYTATVAEDNSTSDGCSAGVNVNRAFEKYDVGETVKIRAEFNGKTKTWQETAKAKDGNTCYFSTIPIAIRRELGVSAHDDFRFWVRPVRTDKIQINETVQVVVPRDTATDLVGWLQNYADYCEIAGNEHADEVRNLARKFNSKLN
jgi:hypothetical protein